jgi:5-methyltetrahydrofolate--homocysteine methyltransferase
MELLRDLSDGLQSGDVARVTKLTSMGLEQGLEPRTILDDGLIAGMSVVGEKFKQREIFLPDVLLAAKAMNAGLGLLKPLLITEGIPTIGKVVIGTVKGDLHDIGKNLVAIMLKGAGFEVIDLGHDVPPEKFIDVAQKEHADVIGLSALLTTTMTVMKDVVALARQRQICGRTKIIVGGAPLSAEFARHIGADAYCYDAVHAVEYVKKSLGRS